MSSSTSSSLSRSDNTWSKAIGFKYQEGKTIALTINVMHGSGEQKQISNPNNPKEEHENVIIEQNPKKKKKSFCKPPQCSKSKWRKMWSERCITNNLTCIHTNKTNTQEVNRTNTKILLVRENTVEVLLRFHQNKKYLQDYVYNWPADMGEKWDWEPYGPLFILLCLLLPFIYIP